VADPERVLVVDGVADTAEVLQAVLEPRGLIVNRVSRLDEREIASAADQTAVLVLDADFLHRAAAPDWIARQGIPQVIIGTWHAPAPTGEDSGSEPRRRYLRKPFQFAELVRAIESLIAR
jgi:CheY-like chemotaxis protein